jgi:hypothetical protein
MIESKQRTKERILISFVVVVVFVKCLISHQNLENNNDDDVKK